MESSSYSSEYVFTVFTFLNSVNSSKKDIVGTLPPEISNMILSMLDIDSLISAVLVSQRWQSLCLSDPATFKCIRGYLNERKRIPTENRRPDSRIQHLTSIYVKFLKHMPTRMTSKRKRSDDSNVVVQPPAKKRTMRM